VLDPERARGLHRRGADLGLARHLRGIPEVADDEGAVRALERQAQAGRIEQVGLDDLDPSPGECLGRIASGVAAGDTDRELPQSEQSLHHAAALPPGATEYRDHLLGHGQLLALSRLPAVDAGCLGYWRAAKQKTSTNCEGFAMLWSFARSLAFVPLGTIQRRRGMHERSGRGTLTRSRIIRAAADLFHQKGARATSPDEIIAASRTGKGQFYHYFRNKEGLVHEVLQTYLEAIKSGTSPIDYEISSWRDHERTFAAHLELQKRYQMTRGCPFGTLGNEVSADDELVRQDVSLIFEV